jgi:hypothetical protein
MNTMRQSRTCLLAVTAVSAIAAGASVTVADQTADQMEARIAELESEMARLKGENWLNEERAEQVRDLVHDVLADADTRASLLQQNMTAGYDDGFVISSPDGNFSLRLNGQIQTRFIYNNQNDDAATPDSIGDPIVAGDANRWGFENTRTKLFFSGNIGSPEWLYYIEVNAFRDGGSLTLDDAWIAYDMGNGWKMMMGQFKVPVLREFMVHSMNQLAVERSNVAYFSGAASRTQGFAIDYMADQFHFIASFNDGALSANTPWNVENTEWSFTARGELLLSGSWDQFEDFTSPQGSEQGIMAGAAVHYQSSEYGTSGANSASPLADDELKVLILTADVSMEFDGWNLFGAFVYQNLDSDVSEDQDNWGIVAQGGFYFTEELEGFARFEWADYDPAFSTEDLMLLTIGVNSYYNENVKSTLDFGYAFNQALEVATITGWRPDIADEDGQFVVRAQLQLVF